MWTVDSSGDLREIARHDGHNVVLPRFSPDGRSLDTAIGDAPGVPAEERLWRVNADASGRTELDPGGAADW